MRRPILIVLITVGTLPASTITLTPGGGSIQSTSGGSTGWGFTMSSDPTDYLSVLQSYLVGQTNPALGTYTDFIGPQGGPVNAVLAPGAAPWTEAFDGITQGLGSFTINGGAAPGASDSGHIEVQFEVLAADPNVCGNCALSVQTVDLPFKVTVAPVESSPEPGTFYLLAGGIAWALFPLRRRSAGRSQKNRGNSLWNRAQQSDLRC